MKVLQVILASYIFLIPNLFIKNYARDIEEQKKDLDNLLVKKDNDASAINFDLNKSNYLLGPGDKISLILQENPEEFNGIYTILNDGSISLPLIGQVYLEYLTLKQATELIEFKFSQELLVPQISLIIEESRPIKISVIGEVNNPGIYTSNEDEEIVTVVDAIRAAGGITPNSNLTNVTLKRRLPGIDPQFKVAKLNLFELIYKGSQIQNPYLLDNDILTIQKADNLPKDIAKTASSSLSPRTIEVSIVGAVENPGPIEIKYNTPLLQGIMQAGGLKNPQANRSNIQLVRLNKNGTISRFKYKFNLSEGISKQKNPTLIDGDIVKVYPSKLTKIGRGVNAITSPFTGIVNTVTLFKLLSD